LPCSTWFHENRSTVSNLNRALSEHISLTSGVPQGGHLGLLLFLVYINDLPNCIKHSKVLMFADDVKMFSCVSIAK